MSGTPKPDLPRTAKPARARSLVCPNCASPIEIRASGISISAACPSCGSVLDVSTDAVRLIAEGMSRIRPPLIPIGRRATLAGTEWEAVGYQIRSSEDGAWVWEEYLLYNPYRGFRFLGQDHGHWTLYGMLRRDIGADGVDGLERRAYLPQEEVLARTDYVLGEFYWRVRVGDVVSAREFAAAPYLLSREGGGDEAIWSRGIYVEPPVIKAAFKLDTIPARQGRAPHQTLTSGARNWPVAILALFALFLLAVFVSGPDEDRLVLSKSFTMTAADQDRTLPAIALVVPDSGGNLRLSASTNAMGGMLRLDMSLVAADHRRDTRFVFGTLIGGGTQTADALYASVPGGPYTLLVKPYSNFFEGAPATPWSVSEAPRTPGAPASIRFNLALHRHVPDATNTVLAVLAILIWPVLVTILHWLRRIGGAGG